MSPKSTQDGTLSTYSPPTPTSSLPAAPLPLAPPPSDSSPVSASPFVSVSPGSIQLPASGVSLLAPSTATDSNGTGSAGWLPRAGIC